VENKQDYIARLTVAVQHLHNCAAIHRDTVQVRELFQGKTVWQGDVEVFELVGHPKTTKAYGWIYREPLKELGEVERFVAVLDTPPISSPAMAVRAHIASEHKKSRLPKIPFFLESQEVDTTGKTVYRIFATRRLTQAERDAIRSRQSLRREKSALEKIPGLSGMYKVVEYFAVDGWDLLQ